MSAGSLVLRPESLEAAESLSLLVSDTQSSVLAFAMYESVAEREAAAQAVRERLRIPVREFVVSARQKNPLEFLREMPKSPRACVFIHEAEKGFPELLGYVNLQREALAEAPHAVVFWVREDGLREIGVKAPDFWSWRSGVFDFRGPGFAAGAALGRQARAQVAGELLGRLTGDDWPGFVTEDRRSAALVPLYEQWREGLLDSYVEEKRVAEAFAGFFTRGRTLRELDKLHYDRYAGIDVDTLAQMLRESCQEARCPLPDGDLYRQLEAWVEGLRVLVGQLPDGQKRFQPVVGNAVANLGRAEPEIRGLSLARRAYLNECLEQHRLIRFRGFAAVAGPPEVETAKVFVMPRLVPESGFAERVGREEPKAVPAQRILEGKRAPRRIVILGKPGSGKTTLLEYFALAFASRSGPGLRWTADARGLLPVFYRVRDLENDRKSNPGAGLWQCLHAHCAQRLALDLPAGFFHRQMAAGGLLLLLDGLDEVASEARRIELVDLISAFARSLTGSSRVILTSRPYEYARSRFAADAYRHFELCEFSDEKIRQFIESWRRLHEPSRSAAQEQAERLWNAIQGRDDIHRLARNALLLTMIVRVHWGLGALPDSRVNLYDKCVDTLLEHWAAAAGLGGGPIGLAHKRRFLSQLAFDLQSSAAPGDLAADVSLQIPRADLQRRLEKFLAAFGKPLAAEAEKLVEKLHSRDAILVNFGGDQFGFVHRSFQEYFAAQWIADRHGDFSDFRELLLEKGWLDRPGWQETLCLAFARLSDRNQGRMLLELLKESRVPFALAYLRTGGPQELWLGQLVRFLSKYYREGKEYEGLPVAACAELCAGREEMGPVLPGLFDRERRDGRALAAAVELAEELTRRGVAEARRLLDGFFAESATFGLNTTARMAPVEAGPFPYGEKGKLVEVAAFYLDRYLVTNREYECMIPRHKLERDKYSSDDDQPVIYVNWWEARLFCRWRGPGFRLPTEEEWEKAASWEAARAEKRVYPWGNQFDGPRCNTWESGPRRTTPVGAYPGGASPYGCHDMAGNVWEWTASPWQEGREYPVFRGGAWYDNRGSAACAPRDYDHPHYRGYGLGFRCARTSA